jgi:hypothetical protein
VQYFTIGLAIGCIVGSLTSLYFSNQYKSMIVKIRLKVAIEELYRQYNKLLDDIIYGKISIEDLKIKRNEGKQIL